MSYDWISENKTAPKTRSGDFRPRPLPFLGRVQSDRVGLGVAFAALRRMIIAMRFRTDLASRDVCAVQCCPCPAA